MGYLVNDHTLNIGGGGEMFFLFFGLFLFYFLNYPIKSIPSF